MTSASVLDFPADMKGTAHELESLMQASPPAYELSDLNLPGLTHETHEIAEFTVGDQTFVIPKALDSGHEQNPNAIRNQCIAEGITTANSDRRLSIVPQLKGFDPDHGYMLLERGLKKIPFLSIFEEEKSATLESIVHIQPYQLFKEVRLLEVKGVSVIMDRQLSHLSIDQENGTFMIRDCSIGGSHVTRQQEFIEDFLHVCVQEAERLLSGSPSEQWKRNVSNFMVHINSALEELNSRGELNCDDQSSNIAHFRAIMEAAETLQYENFIPRLNWIYSSQPASVDYHIRMLKLVSEAND